MKEEFRQIEGYDNYYVSNLGNVKSTKGIKERILKNGLSSNGYLHVSLSKNNKVKSLAVHQLVAMAFLNHIPNGNKIVIDHFNHNKIDNSVNNLRILTARENVSHRKNIGTSEYTGVHWAKTKNKWISSIRIDGKLKHIGHFTDEYEAHLAYQTELKCLKN